MKVIQTIFISLFVGFIGIIGLLTWQNETASSKLEGRTYEKFPKLEYNKFLSTEYIGTFEDAFQDQLEGREQFVSFYYNFCKTVYRTNCMNGIAIGKNGHLYNEPEIIDDIEKHKKDNVNPSAKAINEIAEFAKEQGAKLITVSIPRKDVAVEEHLPNWYPSQKKVYQELSQAFESKLSGDVHYIDFLKVVANQSTKSGTGYWLHNDQHMNPYGTELLYKEVMNYIQQYEPDITIRTLEDYQIQNAFVEGGFNRKIGLSVKPEIEPIGMQPKTFQTKYKRYENDSKKTTNKVVLKDIKDQTETVTYAEAYMGGDCGRTVIETENKKAPKILILGSSFTNSLEAMCLPSFSVVSSLDFRNNQSTVTLKEYIKRDEPDYIVLIPTQAVGYFDYEQLKIHLAMGRENK